MSKIFEKNPTESIEWILAIRFWLRVIAVTFPLALLLGTYGYMNYPLGEGASFSNALYHAAQLFILHTPHFGEPVPWSLEVARWLAATSTILVLVNAALFLFYFEKERMDIRRMKDHTILCGLGELGYALARNFNDKKKLVIIEKDLTNEKLTELRKLGAKRFKGNALDPSVLEKVGITQAKFLFALTGDDFDNLTVVKQVRGLAGGNSRLSIAANIDSLNLKAAAGRELSVCSRTDCMLKDRLDHFFLKAVELHQSLGSTENQSALLEYKEAKACLLDYDPDKSTFTSNPGGSLRFFNINELAARYIFRQYPPDRFRQIDQRDAPTMHILMLGYSQIGEELFRLMVQNCHYINRKKIRITLMSLDAEMIKEKVLTKHTHIGELAELQFIRLNPHHLTHTIRMDQGLSDVDVIYICALEDRYQTSYSIRGKEIFGKKVPVIRWYSKEALTDQSEMEKDGIYNVEILKSVAKADHILHEHLDREAMIIHNRWLKRAIKDYISQVDHKLEIREEIPSPKPTLIPWRFLDEETKDDNRSVMEHNLIKLRTYQQLRNNDDYLHPERATVDFGFLIRDDEKKIFHEETVSILAEMEHRRWMATRYFYGWSYHPKRDDDHKLHPNLVPFDDPRLDAGARDYDYQQIREMKEVWELIH